MRYNAAVPYIEALRTRVANQAHEVAKTINEGFEEFQMGAGGWQVELNAPEGPSTGGGAQALQHLRLVPRRPGYPALVVGSVNGVLSTAELRTYEHVALQHELRFKKPLEITPAEYADFMAKADVILNLACLKARHVPPPAELVEEARIAKQILRNTRSVQWAVVVVVLIFALMVVVRLARG